MKQRSNTIDMLNGPLAGKIIIFALPLMASTLIQQLFNTADTIIVGRFAGAQALAAVGSCGALVNLFVNFFVGFSMGSNVTLSRFFGAGDTESVQKGVHTTVTFSALCGILLAILGAVFAPMREITREEMIVALFRLADSLGVDTSQRADLSAFRDADSISDSARDAVSWSIAIGLIRGVGNNELSPDTTTTRAQMAQVMLRFMDHLQKN